MNKGARNFLILILLAICVGIGAYLATSRQRPVTPPPSPSHPRRVEQLVKPEKVKVYRVALKDNKPVLQATEEDIKPGTSPAESALRRLIEQGDEADLANPIPKGTKLLGLTVKDRLATVDLSHEFRDNFSGGSEEEGLLIGAVLRTLGQFKEIKQVQFLVEGKPIDTLGHIDLSGPQDVSWVGTGFGGGD